MEKHVNNPSKLYRKYSDQRSNEVSKSDDHKLNQQELLKDHDKNFLVEDSSHKNQIEKEEDDEHLCIEKCKTFSIRPLNQIKFDHKKQTTHDQLYNFESASECFTVKFSKSDVYLGCGYSTGKIAVLDSGNDFKVQSTIKASDYAVTGLRFRGDSSIIATTADGKIGTWHSQTGKVMHMIEDIKNPLMCIDVNYNNTLFAVGGHDKVVKLYDDETKTLISELVGNYNQVGHSNRIFSVNFHKSNPNLLASGGWDSIVVFYDTRQKEIIGNCLGAHICGDALDMKDNYVLTGSYKVKDQIKIFDIRKFELVETVNWEFNRENHTSYIYCAQFSKSRGTVNNYFAVGGSGINQFRVFDDTDHSKKDDKKHVKDRGLFCCEETPGQVYSLDFSNNLTNILAVGCGDGIVRVYDVKD